MCKLIGVLTIACPDYKTRTVFIQERKYTELCIGDLACIFTYRLLPQGGCTWGDFDPCGVRGGRGICPEQGLRTFMEAECDPFGNRGCACTIRIDIIDLSKGTPPGRI